MLLKWFWVYLYSSAPYEYLFHRRDECCSRWTLQPTQQVNSQNMLMDQTLLLENNLIDKKIASDFRFHQLDRLWRVICWYSEDAKSPVQVFISMKLIPKRLQKNAAHSCNPINGNLSTRTSVQIVKFTMFPLPPWLYLSKTLRVTLLYIIIQATNLYPFL